MDKDKLIVTNGNVMPLHSSQVIIWCKYIHYKEGLTKAVFSFKCVKNIEQFLSLVQIHCIGMNSAKIQREIKEKHNQLNLLN